MYKKLNIIISAITFLSWFAFLFTDLPYCQCHFSVPGTILKMILGGGIGYTTSTLILKSVSEEERKRCQK
jgi:hypothetical protein